MWEPYTVTSTALSNVLVDFLAKFPSLESREPSVTFSWLQTLEKGALTSKS